MVDSVGFGVQPDTTLVGTLLHGVAGCAAIVELGTPGDTLPRARTHRAPETEPFRLSESAVVVIRGAK